MTASIRTLTIWLVFFVALILFFGACGGSPEGPPAGGEPPLADDGGAGTGPPRTTPPHPDDGDVRTYTTDVLLFNGTGTDASNASALGQIAKSHGLTYRQITSSQLEQMTVDEMAAHGVIVWPGGNSTQMTNGLSGAARLRVREAVRVRGVNYVGYCAGAWMAVGSEPRTGQAPSFGLSLVTGQYLQTYYPDGKNPTAAMVPVFFPDGSMRELVWWGGPYLPSFNGEVVARYETGEAAMGQGWGGKGFVVVTGPHPEAPWDWRTIENLTDPDGLDQDVAWNLMEAALKMKPLPAFF